MNMGGTIMEANSSKTVGSIKVSADVILKIAETAACEIEGVASEAGRLVCSSARSKLMGAVRVRLSGETAAVKLELVVLEGYNAVNVSEQVQKSVKAAVQGMTGFTVTKVDVDVAGVQFKE